MKFSKSIEETADESESTYSSISMFKRGPKDGGIDVRTQSWHTASSIPASNTSGRPSKPESKTSASISEFQSDRSFASSVAERSNNNASGSGGWVKKSAIPHGLPMVSFPACLFGSRTETKILPQQPMGDSMRDSESLVDTADSDEEEEDEYQYDDDSDDETVI